MHSQPCHNKNTVKSCKVQKNTKQMFIFKVDVEVVVSPTSYSQTDLLCVNESDDQGNNICKALLETVFRIKRYINPGYYIIMKATQGKLKNVATVDSWPIWTGSSTRLQDHCSITEPCFAPKGGTGRLKEIPPKITGGMKLIRIAILLTLCFIFHQSDACLYYLPSTNVKYHRSQASEQRRPLYKFHIRFPTGNNHENIKWLVQSQHSDLQVFK